MGVIIADAEFSNAAAALMDAAEQVGFIAQRYRVCADALGASGLCSEALSSALDQHAAQVGEACAAAVEAVAGVGDTVSSFVADVDGIDAYLY